MLQMQDSPTRPSPAQPPAKPGLAAAVCSFFRPSQIHIRSFCPFSSSSTQVIKCLGTIHKRRRRKEGEKSRDPTSWFPLAFIPPPDPLSVCGLIIGRVLGRPASAVPAVLESSRSVQRKLLEPPSIGRPRPEHIKS
ncbi:hypothetical protein LZ31DRAFT_221724 [Colletotrichum somersetense]|nr:hypothetical protein LZ31DRAFT_221724 [Colletotrichum somersetense]